MKISLLAAACLLVTTASAMAAEVPLLTMVSHPVADAMVRGIETELKKAGHSVKLYNPAGDQAMMQQMARQIAAAKPAVAISILTPPTNALKGALRKQGTHIYTGVIEPELVGDSGREPSLVGIPTYFNYQQSIELIKSTIPGAKTVGYIMNTSEPQAVAAEKKFAAAAGSQGLKLITVAISGQADLRAAGERAAKADVVLIGAGNVLISGAATVINAANSNRKPIFACDEGSIRAGAIAGWAADYEAAGRAAGRLAVDRLAGKKIVGQAFISNNFIVNEVSARKAGIATKLLKKAK